MIPFENVKVLIVGSHEKIDDSIKIGSTITLIKTDKNILVDCGGFKDKELIVEKLKENDLTPEQIDILFLTHSHLDHLSNMHLFPNAVIYWKFVGGEYPGQRHFPKEGILKRTELRDNTEIVKDVSVLELPGHTSDLIGLKIETNNGKIVVASDALANEKMTNLENKPPTMLLASETDYDNSRKKILEIADYIIPGHGDMFKVEKN
jgi:glyoxylase-like metal-dependent hydrolase (beta-lactamase superfamily II)